MNEFFSHKQEVLSIVNAPDYRYFNDGVNQLAENGIDTHNLSGLLVENVMHKLEGFDALVLIHPDYKNVRKMQLFKHTVEGTVRGCLEVGKPVFCLPIGDADCGLESFVFTETIPLPDFGKDDPTLELIQEEVNFVANILCKPPEEIRLAWGGLVGDLCVPQWRDSYCRETTPPFEGFTEHQGRQLEHPIAYGESIPELTGFGLFS